MAAGCAWNVCLTFEPDRLDRMLGPAARAFIAGAVQREFGDATGFVLKDPRLCLTLPAWLPALRTAGTKVSVLIVIRHPAEVVRSLAARDRLAESETAPHWLHHMLEAERLSRGFDRAVVSYDDLLRDWRTCVTQAGRTAGIAWPRPIAQAEPDIGAFLSDSSRHHAAMQAGAAVGPPRVCEMIEAVWITLRRLADNPRSPGALECLDHIRAQFAAWRRDVCLPGFRVVFPGT